MTRILLFAFLLSCSIPALAQEASSSAAKALEKEALQKIALFTLTKEEAQYTDAIAGLEKAKKMYEDLLAKADKSSIYATLYSNGVSKIDSYFTLYDQQYKESIVNDSSSQDSKVKYDGKEFAVSKKQKQKFELVQTSLKPYK